jgi:serine/threonine-protein kinase
MERTSRARPAGVATNEIVIDRYRLDRPLGTSRMAEVFVATDQLLGRSVALKRLASVAAADATARERFAREARALARVNHPNVVVVFDTDEDDDGRPFLVMELVEGITLRALLDREGRLDPARAVAIAIGICSGLAAVHGRGIVHRDVKPSNVFLSPSGTVKIGDFGIASVASDVTLTRTGEVFGSAPYVSPEQLTGGPVDARTDLYGLGCILFEMVSGRPPFLGEDPASLAYQHVHAKPERADAIVPTLPLELASTIDRLLAKDPAERPQSADKARRALQEVPSTPVESDNATTQPLGPVSATDVLPTAPPSTPPVTTRRSRSRSRPRSLWVAGVVLGVVALLAVNAMYGGAKPAAASRTSAPHASPRASTSPTPSLSPSVTTPTTPVTDPVSGAVASLVGLVQQMESSGGVSGDLATDLQRGLSDLTQGLDRGDGGAVLHALGYMRDKVDKGLEHGDISSASAQQLDNAILRLESLVGGNDQQGDQGGD